MQTTVGCDVDGCAKCKIFSIKIEFSLFSFYDRNRWEDEENKKKRKNERKKDSEHIDK